uniref:Endonuclease/exonuclease/phosphatase domain-containing protein n=1 Tax=Amphiprion percula TaxID=161767 RepID=A0A3P8S3G3_AMPPE
METKPLWSLWVVFGNNMNKLNLVSYNVHALNHPIKRKKILNQLKKLQCSIALLQETHLTDTEHKKIKREWVNQVFYASYGKRRGVAILIGKGTPIKVEKDIKDNTGRYVLIVGSIGDMTISILNVYAPMLITFSISKEKLPPRVWPMLLFGQVTLKAIL